MADANGAAMLYFCLKDTFQAGDVDKCLLSFENRWVLNDSKITFHVESYVWNQGMEIYKPFGLNFMLNQ